MRHFLLVFLSLISFNAHSVEETLETKEFISQQTLDVVLNNNEFAFNLYRNIDETKNFCFSPYSISSALAMVYNGAREQTQKEMSQVLNFKGDLSSLNESFSALNRFFGQIPKEKKADSRLDILNSLWIQSTLQVMPQFLDDLAKYFKVAVHKVDFFRQARLVREEINHFVREKTMGKITNLLEESDVDRMTKMVLTSVIYMKMKWQKPFDASNTKMEPFFVSSESKVLAPTMMDAGFYPYFKSTDYQAVSLAYARSKESLPNLNFLVILPNEKIEISTIEKQISGEALKDLISELESNELNLFLPKFNFTKAFNLKKVLMQMGMNDAFESNANFEGITGNQELKLGQVAHKVFIAIDEAGTEAAAATAVTMNTKSFLRDKEPLVFRIDRPFIFVIYEKLTGSILFCGRIVNPLESF